MAVPAGFWLPGFHLLRKPVVETLWADGWVPAVVGHLLCGTAGLGLAALCLDHHWERCWAPPVPFLPLCRHH